MGWDILSLEFNVTRQLYDFHIHFCWLSTFLKEDLENEWQKGQASESVCNDYSPLLFTSNPSLTSGLLLAVMVNSGVCSTMGKEEMNWVCSAVPYASHLISVHQENGCPDNVADFIRQTSQFGIIQKMNLSCEKFTSGINSARASLEFFVSACVLNNRFLPSKHRYFLW